MSWGSANAAFEQVADVLIAGCLADEIKTDVCFGLIGLFSENDWDPEAALDRYSDDPAIAQAFRERGVFLTCAVGSWNGDYQCALDDGHDEELHDDGVGHRWREHTPAVLLEDARALAKALFGRLKDFVSDEGVFGEGLSGDTMPDWMTGDGLGRALWAYGAEEDGDDA